MIVLVAFFILFFIWWQKGFWLLEICFLVRSSKTEEGRIGRRVGVDVCHLIIKTGDSPVYIYSRSYSSHASSNLPHLAEF